MGQLAKQLAEKSNGKFVANTKKNPKEECKAVLTRSMRKKKGLEKEDRVEEVGKNVRKEKVEDERKKKEVENNERALEEEKNKEVEKEKKF